MVGTMAIYNSRVPGNCRYIAGQPYKVGEITNHLLLYYHLHFKNWSIIIQFKVFFFFRWLHSLLEILLPGNLEI